MSKLRAAINRVMTDLSVEGIAKLRKNEAQGFKFRGIDDVLNFVSPIYARHGLIVVPSFSNHSITERRTTVEKGGKSYERVMYVATIAGTFRMHHAEDPGEVLEAGPFIGEAMDTADKATNKAMSAAYKYFALLTFAIPVEGTPDADAEGGGEPDAPAEPAKKEGEPIDVKLWIKNFAALNTREELVGAWGMLKLVAKDAPDQQQAMAAMEVLKAARDARIKAINEEKKQAKGEKGDAGN